MTFLHRAKNTEITPTKQSDNIYYTIFGSHDFIDDEGNPRLCSDQDQVFAKEIISNKSSSKYFIKTGLYGKVYNPIGMYSEGKHNKFLTKVGKKEYDYKQVNKKVFDLYINFLRTKNLAWLNNAERELT